MPYPLIRRPRRLRMHATLRALTCETHLSASQFVQPLFVKYGVNVKTPIASMPGCFQFSVDRLLEKVQELVEIGITAVLLFGIPEYKDSEGTAGSDPQGVVQAAIRQIKERFPDLFVIADVCLCEYTDHGHCGVVEMAQNGYHVANDPSLILIAEQAVSLVEAGADMVAPSGMLDGMVGAIRLALDEAGYVDTPILSYAVKYASHFYGPFRQAAEGAPQFGDRHSYQMQPTNAQEALKEAELDCLEGADILMVKPAHTYLDVIYRVKQSFPTMPLWAYHTSGETSMLHAAIAQGWLQPEAIDEVLLSIKRAGADVIITYFAEDWVRKSRQ